MSKANKQKPSRLIEGETGDKLRRKVNKPVGRRKIADLRTDTGDLSNIADETIRTLFELGYITEIVAELKSGKEATAYVARNGETSVLVKLYRDLSSQVFKHNDIYREGETVNSGRAAYAIKRRKGMSLLQYEWVMSEYARLWELWRAGLNVPQPLVGPESNLYAETVPAVLMTLIGSEDAPAPRLSDLRLSPTEAQSAWEQSVRGMAQLLRLGYVHGDYSAYNLLWWQEKVYIIDFPQLTTQQNPNFSALLQRDAQSLSQSFRKHGIQCTPEETLQMVEEMALELSPKE